MPHNRYYINSPLALETTVRLEGAEFHHFSRVLRGKEGEEVELVNGCGTLVLATVDAVTRHEATLHIDTLLKTEDPPSEVILALALPRMAHLEWVVEKATELGCTTFWLFSGTWSEKETLSPTQLARLHHLSLAAMKQCGRLSLPRILMKPPLVEWGKVEGTLLLADTAPSTPYLWEVFLKKPIATPLIWFIGPEKGFHPDERTFLLKILQATSVSLHPNILRAETAPLVALSLSQQYL